MPRRNAEFVAFAAGLHDLFSQSPPAGCADVAAGEGASREGHDLIDLAPRDFHFNGGVQEIGRIHDELQRFAGGKNRPHAG
jgi:hypothetical protein